MKKFILLFAFLCASIAASWAQELKIKSFKPAPTDIYAKLHPVKDLNGEDCALIRIKIAKKDIQIGGSVVKVEVKGGEYLAYMPAGTRHLKIWDPEYTFIPMMVDFKELLRKKERLESGHVYTLVLEVPERTGEVHLTVENLYLSTTKEPVNITPAADKTAASWAQQELKIKSFKPTLADITAQKNPVKDPNGEDCALIRIKIAKKDIQIDGPVKVEVKAGEYLAYVSVLTRFIKIWDPEYTFIPMRVDFKELLGTEEKLKSNAVYTLVLEVPERNR